MIHAYSDLYLESAQNIIGHMFDFAVNENKILLGLERAGEFIVTPVALLFSDFNYKGWNFWVVVLLLSFLCMVLYEIFWVRYFRSEKTMQDFYSSLRSYLLVWNTDILLPHFQSKLHSWFHRLLVVREPIQEHHPVF